MSNLHNDTKINPPEKTSLTDLHWFNVPGVPPKGSTRTDPFFMHLQQLTGMSMNTPLYIYMANGKMTDLQDMDHSEKSINKLNEVGLHIFLYEPICSYLEGQPHNQQFYTEFANEIDIELLRSEELESIKNYAIANKLTNITVHTCDYDIDKYYPHYTPYMKLLCDDLFLKNQTVFNNVGPELTYDFTKKFISTNWRYCKHRHLIAAYLTKFESHLSWYYEVDEPVFVDGLWFDIDDWTKNHPEHFRLVVEGMRMLNWQAPLILDATNAGVTKLIDGCQTYYPVDDYSTPAISNQMNNSLEKFYRDSFVDIVTESRFAQPTANYSEKVYQAILHRKPFIVVAPPNVVKYIKESGFKTFSEFWDESYDSCLNHEERLIKIFQLIDWIDEQPLDKLKEMYKQMKDIVEYNYELLVTKTPFKSIQLIEEQ